MNSPSPLHVEVTPGDAYEQRRRLFEALESVYPVRFQVSGTGEQDATVAFVREAGEQPTTSGPTLVLVDEPHPGADRRFGSIAFRVSDLLPRPFHGRVLTESSTPGGALPAAFDGWGQVLATCSSGPVWLGREGLQYAAAGWPVEPAPGEPLREQLTPGRFIGLLPLAHFLRRLSEQVSYEQPESKACFVFDDPNLHWWTYGFLDYRRLSAHAEANDYHVTAATVPLDQWYIHRGTAEFLRRQSRISFAIHGNNHTRHELRRIDEPGPASALAGQALRRVGAVRRAGVDIGSVMVPPHGVCSLAMLEGCLRTGFDALCADWPYWWLLEPNALSTLSGWRPLDRLGGLPVIPRMHLVGSDQDDLLFRAFLGQPLILYAHHTDLRAGLDLLAARADEVRSLGVDSWQSLGTIAQGVVSTYRRESSMAVILYSRSAAVTIPEGISHARFTVPGTDLSEAGPFLDIRDADGLRRIGVGERVPVSDGATVATLALEPGASPTGSALQIRAAVRRLLGEGRDRAAPFRSRIAVARHRAPTR